MNSHVDATPSDRPLQEGSDIQENIETILRNHQEFRHTRRGEGGGGAGDDL